MRFGPVPLEQAEGTILAHGLTLGEFRLKKGHLLRVADLAGLAAAGVAAVTVARLDPDDLAEDQAAAIIAAALVPDPVAQGLRIGAAGSGRVNLYATGPGVIVADAGAIGRLNAVDPMITLATLPPFQRVADGAMVATVKIISYAVPRQAVVLAVAAGRAALRRAAPALPDACLIETVIPGRDLPGKGRTAMAARLDRLGLRLTPPIRVAHDEDKLAAAIAAAPGAAILILTASATSDVLDVAPAALCRAGGEVIRFGMPVDPGNLLFLGRLGPRPVIGLPGCARSPALNGADWVLERVLCGIEVTAADIAAMGVGGLLKEIPIRPRPREG